MTMAKRKRSKSRGKKSLPVQKRMNVAWRNFVLYLMLFILSFVLYFFSTSSLLVNLFAITSIILGFLAFAFLIVLIALALSRRKR
jgi:uncharacterized integral membrane protein